jgi:hypothetical protein
MKISRFPYYSVLSIFAFFICSVQSQATELADVVHLTDDYPACTFSPIDARTKDPIKNVFVVTEWFKNVSVMEYATKPCRENYRIESDESLFSIPAARCSGFRHGTTLEIRVKALGYRLKQFRILRRPKKSNHIPHITYLSIRDCGTGVQQLPLDKIQSLNEALKQYQDSYARRQIIKVFGDTEAFYERMIRELRSFDSSLDVAGAKKAYCETVLKDTPSNLRDMKEPYCRDLK